MLRRHSFSEVDFPARDDDMPRKEQKRRRNGVFYVLSSLSSLVSSCSLVFFVIALVLLIKVETDVVLTTNPPLYAFDSILSSSRSNKQYRVVDDRLDSFFRSLLHLE